MSEYKDDNEPISDNEGFSSKDSFAQQNDLDAPEQADQNGESLHGDEEPELFIDSIEQQDSNNPIPFESQAFDVTSDDHAPAVETPESSSADLGGDLELYVDANEQTGEPELFINTIEELQEPSVEPEYEADEELEEFIDESGPDPIDDGLEVQPEPEDTGSDLLSPHESETVQEEEFESADTGDEAQVTQEDNDSLPTEELSEETPEEQEQPQDIVSIDEAQSESGPIDEELAEPEPVEEEVAADESSEAASKTEEDVEEVSPEDMEYMSDTSAAMLMRTPKGGRLLIYVMMLAIGSSLIWASMAPLDEITRGVGNVIPSSRLQVIQNLEGGILETLFVQEGELVREGQPLMQLDDTRFTSTFREGAVEYYSELARAARLSAELTGKNLKFPPELDEYQDYVNREVQVYEKRAAGLTAELDIASTQTSQAKHELASAEAQLEFLDTSFKLGKEELGLTAPLAKLGVVSQVEMIQLKQRVNELGSEKKLTELSIPKLEAAYQEALARKREVKIKFREEVVQELKEAEIRLDQLTETQANLKDQVVRTMVRSPVEGIVKKINLTTVGGVIQPGMDLMEIVPVEDNLLVEVQISPKDIGFLREGMRAVVKLTAYDFAIYGGLEGTLEHISADTIKDEKGESFYIVRIRTARSHLGTEDTPLEIIPGMKTNVDIITGEKTLMAYLLKPILRAKQNALTER